MSEPRGPITLLFRKSSASLALAGAICIAASFSTAILTMAAGGLPVVPPRLTFPYGIIPKSFIGLGCLAAFGIGVLLLEFAALAWVFGWLAPANPSDSSGDFSPRSN